MKKIESNIPKRSGCPIATTLDVIGDKWTLLIIRDIGLFNKHKNKDFQDAGEKIPTNILADRLKSLVSYNLVEKKQYQDNPPRYEYHLTSAGNDMIPIIQAMALWAAQYVKGVKIPEFEKQGSD